MPNSEIYLIHPVLGSYIQQYTTDFVFNINTRNIIRPGAEWRKDNGMRFVAKGDIKSYSQIMMDPGLAHTFPDFFYNIVRDATIYIQYWKIHDGDALEIIDANPYQIVRAIRSIRASLIQSYFGCDIRFGLSWGLISFQDDDAPRTGLPLRQAARLEPLAKPGTVLMTEGARAALMEHDLPLSIVEIHAEDSYDIEHTDAGWNIGKQRSNGDEEKDLVIKKLFAMKLEATAPLFL